MKLRDAFACSRGGVTYLNAGGFGPCPDSVHSAIVGALGAVNAEYHCIDYSPLLGEHQSGATQLALRLRLEQYFGAEPHTITLTGGAAEGIAMALGGYVGSIDRGVACTSLDHIGAAHPALRLARKHGVSFKVMDLSACLDALVTPERAIAEFEAFLRRERPSVMVVPHAIYKNGCVLPVAELASVARQWGCLLIVDGAQGPGMLTVDISRMGVDVYSASMHKWFCGGPSTGFLYIRPSVLGLIRPILGIGPIDGLTMYGPCPPDWAQLVSRFFPGTGEHGLRHVNYPAEIGLAAAVQFNVDNRDALCPGSYQRRAREFLELLSQRVKMTTCSPEHPDLQSGMVAFRIDGVEPQHLANTMKQRFKVVLRSVDDRFTGWRANRVCFGPMVDDESVGHAVECIVEACSESL
jgi:selenocysteine lyase/cysteine desulfurase